MSTSCDESMMTTCYNNHIAAGAAGHQRLYEYPEAPKNKPPELENPVSGRWTSLACCSGASRLRKCKASPHQCCGGRGFRDHNTACDPTGLSAFKQVSRGIGKCPARRKAPQSGGPQSLAQLGGHRGWCRRSSPPGPKKSVGFRAQTGRGLHAVGLGVGFRNRNPLAQNSKTP